MTVMKSRTPQSLNQTLPMFRHFDLTKAKKKPEGDISSVFKSLKNSGSENLPEFYSSVKKNLVENPTELTKSWIRLKGKLSEEIKKIKDAGASSISSIDFSQLKGLDTAQLGEIFKRGCFVVRNVLPDQEAKALKKDILKYVADNPHTKAFPSDKKVVYELYWSKAQVRARSNPNLMATLSFANKLWHAQEDSEICLDQNILYADRLRIREGGDKLFALGAHADGGSLERWEDSEYSKCYGKIFEGKWEEFDAFDATHRGEANPDLHESSGTCSIFRSFQGWLALSEIAPNEGSLLLAPLVREVTAYYMLRPFFDESDNIKLDSSMPGAYPGKGLEFSKNSHPEMDLDALMVHIPKMNPGDMVFWHCDLVHAVDSIHMGRHDSSVLYIPSAPLCKRNLEYAWAQRESFLKGLVGPDFPGFPEGIGETEHFGRAGVEDVYKEGGEDALKEFTLDKFKEDNKYSRGAFKAVQKANKTLFD